MTKSKKKMVLRALRDRGFTSEWQIAASLQYFGNMSAKEIRRFRHRIKVFGSL